MTARPLRKPLLAALLAIFAVSVAAPSAGAADANPIEGVWAYGGGAVAVQPLPNGDYQGVVVNPTSFLSCEHPAEELMWTDMHQQADGSFWGFHQWFQGGDECELNPRLGLTAWRVEKAPDGSSSLLVCFSIPGRDSQPTIASPGMAENASYGCKKLEPLAPLPVVKAGDAGFDSVVGVPASKACVPRRSLKIVPRGPQYDPLKEVVIRVNGKKVADVTDPDRLKKVIRLKHLPQGSYRVSVLAITVLNQRISGGRNYRACVKGPGKIKVPASNSYIRHKLA
jgi:hypothetical protein